MRIQPSALLLAPALLCASALQEKLPTGYTDTPLLPGPKWHVHDPSLRKGGGLVDAPGMGLRPRTRWRPLRVLRDAITRR